MSSEDWLVWADWAYFGFAAIAAMATAITVLAGLAQNRLNARIGEAKDREFARFQQESNNTAVALREQAARAFERAALAEQRAAEANQKAEEERLARMRIEERLAARSLINRQMESMTNRL